jgi:ABC-type phosphate/phosphonate transport system substrate-binding protein
MCKSLLINTLVVGLFGLLIQTASADNSSDAKQASTADAVNAKVSYRPAGQAAPAPANLPDSSEYVFSAPPRENVEEGKRIYGPVAEYLSQATGKHIVYRHPGTWGVYQGAMQHGNYDIVFDGAHFNGWRVAKIQHNMLVKVPGEHVFVALVKSDNTRIRDIKQLAGYSVCAHAPPNLGTLTLLEQFTNPARQPIIVSTNGWKNIYEGMLADKCVAAVIPLAKLEEFEKKTGTKSKIIYRAKTLPDNAFSAGPRLNAEDQAKLVKALLAPAALGPTQAMRQKYAADKAFVRASNEEYASLGEYLRNEWGYY